MVIGGQASAAEPRDRKSHPDRHHLPGTPLVRVVKCAEMKVFEIREATEEDAGRLQEFVAGVISERLPVLLEKSSPPSIDQERDFIRRVLEPGGVILVATIGDRIVGLLDFHREKRPQAAHGGGFGMSVAKEYRRQGIGSALLEALIAWAQSRSVWRLELEVFESNDRAIRLYEKMGFQLEGRRRKAVVVGNERLDVLLMARLSTDEGAGSHAAAYQ
jgi:RimJ/RimL family protein N-acetyltransferase